MINYILQILLCQVLFLAVYDFFLSKETFFTKNRWYLLVTPIVSFLIPLIKISRFKQVISNEYIIVLPEIVLNPDKVIQQTMEQSNFEATSNYVNIIFWMGVVIFTLIFALKLMKIIQLIYKSDKLKKSSYTIVLLPEKSKVFSFFNYIFLGNKVDEHQQEKVIQHELVHAKQKHTLDLLFFEVLKIIMWFNPLLRIYQKRITLVHEYISDSEVSKTEAKESYINNLLSNFFQVENIAFVNQFYKKSLIKKRIVMMTKTQSRKISQLKYLILVPVLVSMMFYVSCSEELDNDIVFSQELQNIKQYFPEGEKLNVETFDKQTYLDHYFAFQDKPLGIEITESDLFPNALKEYKAYVSKFIEQRGDKVYNLYEYKLYYYKRRPVIGIHKRKNFSTKVESKYIDADSEEVSFMTIEKAPTFPGCEEGDKNCFSKMIQKHFAKNFDADLPKNLGLSSGKKRVFIGFKISKDGTIVDIQVRAPHTKIEEEVTRVMELLPKVKPGEMDNKTVAVKYSIPFAIIVE